MVADSLVDGNGGAGELAVVVAARVKLPRVPLPRQKGGAHKVTTKVGWRKQKHKGKVDD